MVIGGDRQRGQSYERVSNERRSGQMPKSRVFPTLLGKDTCAQPELEFIAPQLGCSGGERLKHPLHLHRSSLKVAGGTLHAVTMSKPAFTTAATHPAYKVVGPTCEVYPKQAAAVWQAYCDLSYAANWSELQPLETDAPWALLVGTPPPPLVGAGATHTPSATPSKPTAVFPVDLAAILSPGDLSGVFGALPSHVDNETILLAVVSNDSTVVYYKLARGLVKPVN